MTCTEQLNNSILKVGECCENPKIFSTPLEVYANYRNLKSLVMHDIQPGNRNHGDYHTQFDLCDFKMPALKQTMICLLNCFIWLNYSSTDLWDFFLLGHLALHVVHLTLTLDFLLTHNALF